MKKILFTCLLFAAICSTNVSFAATVDDSRIEHLKYVKNAGTNIVRISNQGTAIQRDNKLEIGFSENFNSKYYKKGDMVEFNFNEDIKTEEGTLLIPKDSKLVAAIENIQAPKWLSRNAKVSLNFMYLLYPNGTRVSASMELANGKGYLAHGAAATTGKIAAYTLTLGGVGAGLGAAIGTASSHTIPGLIIGGSIGGGVGLISGVVSPGLHYRAKKGTKIPVRLQDNLTIPSL